MVKTRLWCFTNFNLNWDWDEFYECTDNVTYIAYGDEVCPKTDRKHQQGWIRFKNPVTSARKILTGMHVEGMRGSLKQNDKYCSKEGELHEWGSKPRHGERRDLSDVFEAIANGESQLSLAESNPAQWVQYGRRFEDYRRLLIPKRNSKTHVSVFWGDTYTGKSHLAWERDPEMASVSFANGFCIGYSGERAVLLDDFDESTISRELFLKLTDRYPLTVNVKNGEVQWSPARLYITSNYNPDLLYNGCPAVRRRLDEIVHMEQKYGTEVSIG